MAEVFFLSMEGLYETLSTQNMGGEVINVIRTRWRSECKFYFLAKLNLTVYINYNKFLTLVFCVSDVK